MAEAEAKPTEKDTTRVRNMPCCFKEVVFVACVTASSSSSSSSSLFCWTCSLFCGVAKVFTKMF